MKYKFQFSERAVLNFLITLFFGTCRQSERQTKVNINDTNRTQNFTLQQIIKAYLLQSNSLFQTK